MVRIERPEMAEIDIDSIDTTRYPLRMGNDPRRIRALVESIDRVGLLNPLTVAKREDGKYDLISGHMRLAALRQAGWSRIPVTIIPAGRVRAIETAVTENLVRTDLNPIDKARALRTLKEQGLSQREIADLINRKEPEVSNLLALFKLEPEAVAAIEEGRLKYPQAKAVSALRGQRDLQLQALRKILDEKLNARAAERVVREIRGRQTEHQSLKLPERARIEEGARSFRLVFEYNTLNELISQVEVFVRENFAT